MDSICLTVVEWVRFPISFRFSFLNQAFLRIYPSRHTFQICCLKIVLFFNCSQTHSDIPTVIYISVLFSFCLTISLESYQFYYSFQKNNIGFVDPLYWISSISFGFIFLSGCNLLKWMFNTLIYSLFVIYICKL